MEQMCGAFWSWKIGDELPKVDWDCASCPLVAQEQTLKSSVRGMCIIMKHQPCLVPASPSPSTGCRCRNSLRSTSRALSGTFRQA